MKKRKSLLSFLLVSAICISEGCGGNRSGNYAVREQDNTENSVVAEDVSSVVTLDLANYQLDDETSYNANMPYLAVTEDGIYFWAASLLWMRTIRAESA